MSLRMVLMRNREEPHDSYCDHLHHLGSVECIPTLSFDFVNIDELRENLAAHEKWSGIIFTSKRAIETVKAAFKAEKLLGWKDKCCFVVGEATRREAMIMGFNCVGEECGNATALTSVIDQFHNEGNLPLVFVCGQMRRDELPKFMDMKGIPYKVIVTYQTAANSALHSAIERYVAANNYPTHIVYFSPSGYNFAHHIWKKELGDFLEQVQLVAIGKTTANEIDATSGKVLVATKPNPSSVSDAIASSLKEDSQLIG